MWDQSTGFSMTEHTPGKSADSRDHLSYDPAFASFQAMTAAAARSAASTAPDDGASPPRGSSTFLISSSARIAFFSAASAGASSASTIPRRPVYSLILSHGRGAYPAILMTHDLTVMTAAPPPDETNDAGDPSGLTHDTTPL